MISAFFSRISESVALKLTFDLDYPRPARSVTAVHCFLQLITFLLIDWLSAILVTSDTAGSTAAAASLASGQH
jgi:hypothetical protein